MNLRVLVLYTMVEMLMQPLFKAFFAITGLLFLFLALVPNLPNPTAVTEITYIFFLLYFIVATAGIMIERTERGSIEMFLSKPFSRRDIVIGSVFGVIVLVSVLSLYLIFGIWVVWSLRTGVWNLSFFAQIGSLLFGFATLYCFVVLSGILVHNVAAIVFVWCAYVMFGSLLLDARSWMLYPMIESSIVNAALDVLYFVLPQLSAISATFNILGAGQVPSFLPVITSCLVACLALLLAIFVLERKDL